MCAFGLSVYFFFFFYFTKCIDLGFGIDELLFVLDNEKRQIDTHPCYARTKFVPSDTWRQQQQQQQIKILFYKTQSVTQGR